MPEKHSPDHIPKMPAGDAAGREKADQALAEYTYTVSHDLNAPLRHIIQYGKLLKMEVGDRLGADGTMYVNRLILSGRRLQRLVNDLLSYAQILHITEKEQQLNLNTVVATVLESMAGLIEENNATVNVGDLPVLYAYPFRMAQLFRNLIENAIKYRSAKDPIITIACVDENQQSLFSVRDNSMGIPQEHQEAIFKALKRLHSQDDMDGSGLGLAICEKAVEAHGGRIWVESHPGEGAAFFFTIPKNAAARSVQE